MISFSHAAAAVFMPAVLIIMCANVSAQPFTVIHISDAHIKAGSQSFAKNLSKIIDDINAMQPKPAMVIDTGDMTEMGFTDDYEDYLKLVSDLKAPLHNVAGNHEAKWSNWGKSGLPQFLKQNPYYSFDCGQVHFIGLDSSMWLEHNGFLDQSQLNWLKKDLESAGRERPVVLFYHHCPGYLPNEFQFLRMLRPYNVRLALVGHGHTFTTWKKNGITFQMVKGAMNDSGGYRILEFSDNEIRSFTQEPGGKRKADGIIPLAPVANPVTITRPLPNRHIDGPLNLRAVVTPGDYAEVEYGIDGRYEPITPGPDGVCNAAINWAGAPGWHTVSVRATDKAGMEWIDSIPVRINTGSREIWRVKVSGAVQRPVRAAGDRLYFGTWGGDVYCLDARTGHEIWRRNAGSDVVCRIAVESGRAYLGTCDGLVMAMDAGTGEPLWEYKTNGPVQGSPAVGGGSVFIGSGDSNLYALNAETGKLRWKFQMNRMTQTLPVYFNNTVYFGAWDQSFYALNAADGSVRWKTHVGDLIYFSPANSNPATDGKRIIVAATPWHEGDPDLFCFDAKTGDILWKRRNPGAKSHCAFNSPFIDGDRFFIASLNGGLFCMKTADGRDIWQSSTENETYDNSPVAADGKIYIGGLKGGLFRFDAVTGKKEAAYSVGGPYLFASPTIWQDLVIVPSVEGIITAVSGEF